MTMRTVSRIFVFVALLGLAVAPGTVAQEATPPVGEGLPACANGARAHAAEGEDDPKLPEWQTATMTNARTGEEFAIGDFHGCSVYVETMATWANVTDFFWAEPDAQLIERAHAGEALVCWQVGSLAEAVAAANAGCDFIVVQGIESGGHVRGRVGLLALLDQTLETVDVPVLAAGGIGTYRFQLATRCSLSQGITLDCRKLDGESAKALAHRAAQ